MKIDKALLRHLCGLGLAGALVLSTQALGDDAMTNSNNNNGSTNSGVMNNDTGAATDMGTGSSDTTNEMKRPSESVDATVNENSTAMVSFNDLNSEEIKQIQSALNEQGSAIQVDGVIGPETKGALSDFQKRNDLQASSSGLSRETLSQLGVEDIMQAH